ncbi:MAG: GNAT family N-acetyltransferase [Bacteroidota bacterium]
MKEIASKYGVTIREWQNKDIDDYADLISDSEVMRFISNGKTRTQEIAAQEIKKFKKEASVYGWSRWVVEKSETGEFIGYVGFSNQEHGIDLGGRAKKKFWGTVYPFISFFLAIQYGFENIGFMQFYTLTNIKNRQAISMNEKILYASFTEPVLETKYGPHLKIDYTKSLYDRVKDRNIARIERLSSRMKTI